MNPVPPISWAEHFRIRLSLQLINYDTHNDNDFPLKTGTENILKPTDATDVGCARTSARTSTLHRKYTKNVGIELTLIGNWKFLNSVGS